jgi:hypothetical protein
MPLNKHEVLEQVGHTYRRKQRKAKVAFSASGRAASSAQSEQQRQESSAQLDANTWIAETAESGYLPTTLPFFNSETDSKAKNKKKAASAYDSLELIKENSSFGGK